MNTKKERIAYFQSLVDKGMTYEQIKADKEVSSWSLAESTLNRYCVECDLVIETKEEENKPPEKEKDKEKESDQAKNPELDSDKSKPKPKPKVKKEASFNEDSEKVQLERCQKFFENAIEVYTKLIELRLRAKKSTIRIVGLRKKAYHHVKQIKTVIKG